MHSNKDERNGIAHPHGHHHQHQHHHDVDKSPYDRHDSHIWSSWSEDATDQEGHVLTLDGISQIAHHKYVAGQYTHLDNVCNPYWTQLTEQLLPTWMAPNVVTSIGGLACLASYLVTWYYLPQFEPMTIQGGSSGGGGDDDFDTVPPQLLWFNGIAVFLYFTLDCMDGKQARRTNSSSPLGQLFDHGVDCFANLSQLSVCQSFLLMGPSRGYLWSHLGLQWAFFAPQWEEYYTGILQSSYGKWLGVTEVNYGLAIITIFNSFFDTRSFYRQTLQQLLPISTLPQSTITPSFFVTVFNTVVTSQLKYLILYGWIAMATSIVLGCIYRTAVYLKRPYSIYVAVTKFLSPTIVTILVLFVVPSSVVHQECRLISLATGLCLCLVTTKMIVFSMARMAYGAIQMDILPLIFGLGFISWECQYCDLWNQPRRMTPLGVTFVLQVLVGWYFIRNVFWTHAAIAQLSEKLGVYVFSIQKKKQS